MDSGKTLLRNGPQPGEPFNNTRVITLREIRDSLPCSKCLVTVSLTAMMENDLMQGLSATSVEEIGKLKAIIHTHNGP